MRQWKVSGQRLSANVQIVSFIHLSKPVLKSLAISWDFTIEYADTLLWATSVPVSLKRTLRDNFALY